jgi:hypothetical protein
MDRSTIANDRRPDPTDRLRLGATKRGSADPAGMDGGFETHWDFTGRVGSTGRSRSAIRNEKWRSVAAESLSAASTIARRVS